MSASQALLMIDEQVRRAQQWLEHDAPAYWKQQIRICLDEVARTRSALESCRTRTAGDNRPSCIEEQEAYRAARRRLQQAEEKVEVVSRWVQRLRREIDDYRGRTMRFRRCLETEIPRTMALLERTVSSLEKYVDHRLAPIEGELALPFTQEQPPLHVAPPQQPSPGTPPARNVFGETHEIR